MSSGAPRPVWILGAGRSGQAAAVLAEAEGREVRIFDEGEGESSCSTDVGFSSSFTELPPLFQVWSNWIESIPQAYPNT